MDFGDFLNNFGNIYCSKWKKEDFCKKLLCSIVKNEDDVIYKKGIKDKKHERGDQTFQSYYKNHDRRFPKDMAIAMINNIDTEKFKRFLVEYTSGDNGKAKLSENFKNEIPDINEDNLFEKLTEKYIEILRYESNKPDKRSEKPSSIQPTTRSNVQSVENYQTVDFEKKDNAEHIEILNGESNKSENSSEKPIIILTATISNPQAEVNDNTKSIDDLVNKLKETLDSLISNGSSISSWQIENPWVDTDEKLESDLNEAYDKFLTLYNEIKAYNIENNTELLNKIIKSMNKINRKSFIQTNESFKLVSSKNYSIHELLSILQNYNQN